MEMNIRKSVRLQFNNRSITYKFSDAIGGGRKVVKWKGMFKANDIVFKQSLISHVLTKTPSKLGKIDESGIDEHDGMSDESEFEFAIILLLRSSCSSAVY